jgi:hypothetical protein
MLNWEERVYIHDSFLFSNKEFGIIYLRTLTVKSISILMYVWHELLLVVQPMYAWRWHRIICRGFVGRTRTCMGLVSSRLVSSPGAGGPARSKPHAHAFMAHGCWGWAIDVRACLAACDDTWTEHVVVLQAAARYLARLLYTGRLSLCL